MNSKALALLIILRVIRANPSDYSNIGEKIGCADHEASFTLARIDRSIDCAISLGSLSNETQFAAPRKETIKNLGKISSFSGKLKNSWNYRNRKNYKSVNQTDMKRFDLIVEISVNEIVNTLIFGIKYAKENFVKIII